MREIHTEVIIDAPIEKIWSTLVNFSSYPTWNPFIRNIEGNPQVNEKLTVTIQPPGKKPMIFRPRILSLSKYEFKWIGNLWVPGIFDGTHRFLLLPESDGKVRFVHSESFSGLLCVPIFGLINKSTKTGFENMNQALKHRSESN